MKRNLTNDHRRLLGVAIAVAKADGVLDTSEQALLDHLCEQLHALVNHLPSGKGGRRTEV